MIYTLTCHRHVDVNLSHGQPPAGLLTSTESAIFAGLKTEKRRLDWLIGRYTAKHLLKIAYSAKAGTELSLFDFAILNKQNGAPYIFWEKGKGNGPVSLSISHTGETAFCALTFQNNVQLGCDVESISRRSTIFLEDYFTPAEQALVSQLSGAQKNILVNAIWSGKEAVLKALELGLTVDTRAVTCLPQRMDTYHFQPIDIYVDSTRISRPVSELAGRWRVAGQYVYCLAGSDDLFAEPPQRVNL